jgi:hypothetical protein
LAAASGLAFSSFLIVSPVFGQAVAPGEHVDANGMPTTHSTPQEQAETAQINKQAAAAAGSTVADAQTDANNAQYQSQQQQYQQQQQQYQNQLAHNQAQQEHYRDRTAAYEGLRLRYAAERAAYHRGLWPDRDRWVVVQRGDELVGERVQLLSGNRVGTVIDTAHSGDGVVEALLVRLDNDKIVWIDAGDIRYNRADGVLMTNLESSDLHHMADERL